MSTTVSPLTPQGDVIALGVPDSQDYPRLVYCAPYFQQVPLAELIEPSVQESVEALLPSLVPPYVQSAADAAVQQLAVLLTGSTMSGPLMLAPLMPTADSMAASKAYVDAMVATAGVPEVPLVPTGQTWARQVGQWVPISEQEGTFLPLAGGTMQGQINMSGYAINNLAALPNMPNGAAPATWVLQQIASVSLYQGTWNMDTYTPDLTNPNTHVNGYTWIAITTSTSGVVIGPAIPGLQGQTVFNGDTIIWSNIQGQFNRIHSGGLSLAEAQALFLPFTGGTMTGPLLAFENPTAAMEVATMGWVQSLLPPGGVIPEAPTDGQLYGRNGLTKVWLPVLPLAGGVMTGPILLSGNATNALSPVPLQQLTSTLAATYMPLAGGTMTGLLVLSGNASANLNPVPLQQLSAMLGAYLPLTGGTINPGALTVNNPSGQGTVNVIGTTGAANGAAVDLIAPAGGFRNIFGETGSAAPGSARWALTLGDSTAESGSNAGSNFAITNYTDAGAPVAPGFPCLTIARATGNATFYTGLVTVNNSLGAQLTLNSSGASTAITLLPLSVESQIYGDSAYFGIGESGPFASTSSWRYMYMRSSGDRYWNDYTNTNQMHLDPGGNLIIHGSLSQGSDSALKENIEAADDCGLIHVRAMLPKRFTRRQPPRDVEGAPPEAPPPPRVELGFVAQDVAAVLPEAVITKKDGLLALDMMPLLAALVNAVKELAVRTETLEAVGIRP